MFLNTRTHANLELAVRYGIILDSEFGAVSAWTFMANNGVSSSVILRVLLDKESRRIGDQLALEITERHQERKSQKIAIQAAFEVPLRSILA